MQSEKDTYRYSDKKNKKVKKTEEKRKRQKDRYIERCMTMYKYTERET